MVERRERKEDVDVCRFEVADLLADAVLPDPGTV